MRGTSKACEGARPKRERAATARGAPSNLRQLLPNGFSRFQDVAAFLGILGESVHGVTGGSVDSTQNPVAGVQHPVATLDLLHLSTRQLYPAEAFPALRVECQLGSSGRIHLLSSVKHLYYTPAVKGMLAWLRIPQRNAGLAGPGIWDVFLWPNVPTLLA